MAVPISRNGDTGAGCGSTGVIVGASSHWNMRGSLVALHGDAYACAEHGIQSLVSNHTFTIRGRSIIRVGDTTTCGATIQTGAPGTFSG